MQRLPFRLPEWAPRTTWVSEEARQVWEPRLQAVSNAWIKLERDLVAARSRPSALQNITPEDLPSLMMQEAARGVTVLPLSQTGKVQGYQSASQPMGKDFDYRCAITKAALAADWAKAWSASDNEAIGKLLGYPQCCRTFFERYWVQEKWFDTTWPMCQNEPNIENAGGIVNTFWRWHGVRGVSHLPCSPRCSESRNIQSLAFSLFRDKYTEEAWWWDDILSWPVEWSALHGIAEIRTPITRTSVATDATADKLTVRYMGKGYPEEGAAGSGFPHRKIMPIRRLSNSMDNGFASHAAMMAAHKVLLSKLQGPYNTILDLGCGDGLLLAKIPAKRRVGIEINERVAQLGAPRMDRVIVGDVTDIQFVNSIIREENPDLVIAQWGRNDPLTLDAQVILSYSYEGETQAKLILKPNGAGDQKAL